MSRFSGSYFVLKALAVKIEKTAAFTAMSTKMEASVAAFAKSATGKN
jgi:hypothetical protein